MLPAGRPPKITRANRTFPEWHLKLKTIHDTRLEKIAQDMTLWAETGFHSITALFPHAELSSQQRVRMWHSPPCRENALQLFY